MNLPQHKIRKLEPTAPRSLDEQIWPIQVGLVILGAYLTTLAGIFLSWQATSIHRHPATYLLGIPLLTGLLIWWVQNHATRVIRRTLLLSLLLSLFANISLLVMFGFVYVFGNAPAPATVTDQPMAQDSQFPIPVYEETLSQLPVEQPRAWEEPIAVSSADASSAAVAQQTTELDVPPSAGATELAADPSMSSSQLPARRALASAPRFSELPNILSRSPHQIVPTESSASQGTGAHPSRQEPQLAMPTESLQPLARSSSEAEAPALEEIDIASAELPAAELSLARPTPERTDAEEVPSQSSQAATLPRRVRDATAVPQSPLDLTESASPLVEDDDATAPSPQPSGTTIAPSASPAPALVVMEDVATPAETPTVRNRRRRDEEAQLSNAEQALTSLVPARSPSLQPALAQAPVDAPSQSTAAPSATESPSLEPTMTAQTESPTAPTAESLAEPPRSETTQSESAANEVVTPNAPAAALVRNSETAEEADSVAEPRESSSASSSEASERSVAQQAPVAAATVEPTELSGSASVGESAEQPAPAPTALSLGQGSTDLPVSGAATNVLDDLPSPPSPSQLASSSAARESAYQEQLEGAALAPSVDNLQPQLRAEARQPVVTADSVAIDTPSELVAAPLSDSSATASATSVDSASNAQLADFTAMKGQHELDLGPPQIATGVGERKGASGGSEPSPGELAADGSTPTSERARLTPQVAAGPVAVPSASSAAESAGDPASNVEPTAAASEALTAEATREAAEAPGSLASSSPGATQPGGGAAAAANELATPSAATQLVRGPQREAAGSLDQALPEVNEQGPARRTSAAPALPVDTQAAVPNLAGAPISSGDNTGNPLQASTWQPDEGLSGIAQALPAEQLGGQRGEETATGTVAPNVRPSPLRPKAAAESGEQEYQVAGGDPGIPAPRGPTNRLPAGARQPVRLVIPGIARQDEDAPSYTPQLLASRATTGGPTPEDLGSVVVINQREEGSGGLGTLAAPDVGLPTRRAQEESQVVSLPEGRFVRQEIAGEIETETKVSNPAPAFRQRVARSGSAGGGQAGRGGPQTEKAVELGLAFLRRQQLPDGHWSLTYQQRGDEKLDDAPLLHSDTAATGLALLSFLGAGYHHQEFRYAGEVERGLKYLIGRQNAEGDLFVPEDPISNRSVWLYSHAIGALALCEAYGMTQDPELREPAQAALNFIVAAQHPERGGWRYSPAFGSDTSVTGWMMMALKSGELAGLEIDRTAYERISRWLDEAELKTSDGIRYAYNPRAPDTVEQRHGRDSTPAMTSVGILMRMYGGWNRNRREVQETGDYLLENLPSFGSRRDPQRDTYYWYYATQVMFHLGGDHWQRWNNRLHPLLVRTQIAEGELAGSWDPATPVPDRWAQHAGRLYVTTMNILSLEVTYRHLPLYDETGK